MIRDIKDKKPNEHTVKYIEALLEDAKNGEIRTIFSITGWDNSEVSSGWSIDPRSDLKRILAEVVILQHALIVDYDLGHVFGVTDD